MAGNQMRRGILSAVLWSVFALVAVWFYSSATRPLWIDEVVHFGVGSCQSTQEAWQTALWTLKNMSHGHTCIQMVLDYWLLQAFGANSFALRLPSLLAGVALFLSTGLVACKLRLNLAWQGLLALALLGQTDLMYFVGEARPYMPFAASVVAAFAFYLTPVSERNVPVRIFGFLAVLTGVLFHPYFSVYWLAVAVLGCLFVEKPKNVAAFARVFPSHCDLLISVPCGVLYFLLARVTWLQGVSETQDPFQWIKPGPFGWLRTLTDGSHLQFLGPVAVVVPFLVGVLVLGFAFPRIRKDAGYHSLWEPLVLLATAVSITLLLAVISYAKSYWILPRQWVASVALAAVGGVWLVERLGVVLQRRHALARPVLVVCLGLLLLAGVVPGLVKLRGDAAFFPQWICGGRLAAREAHPPESPNDWWVAEANRNVSEGGRVWLVFRKFYRLNTPAE